MQPGGGGKSGRPQIVSARVDYWAARAMSTEALMGHTHSQALPFEMAANKHAVSISLWAKDVHGRLHDWSTMSRQRFLIHWFGQYDDK